MVLTCLTVDGLNFLKIETQTPVAISKLVSLHF